jgi:hypothetical protein
MTASLNRQLPPQLTNRLNGVRADCPVILVCPRQPSEIADPRAPEGQQAGESRAHALRELGRSVLDFSSTCIDVDHYHSRHTP